ncbi:Zn-dependent hydrolase [Cryobacterium roopkundense]|uniref:Glyoxylase-like metal-dependent hydrolase (Beta-lactamase superfamily II) n=1 Tax=Cryobacterium roopkundense TaxID=1001240 RepID=A0A099J2E4_9MICO|nr:MBL fold metallo-hydrolase [Cryobacterium roopkundense]KGJ71598.1 Zn-dependent hydrolase [Cryobacterium roopkundense]MBB5640154.1 glyoxylase-like metal-dependent hydrolase (beta-lactamase superfamily II) [Cryobacterium roopkundense]
MYDLTNLTVRSIAVSEMSNNVYLLTSKTTGAQVLIDAADDAPAILALLAGAQSDTSADAKLGLIVTTHSHWDHVRALAELREATQAPTAAGLDDVADIAVPTDVPLHHRDVRSIDDIDLEVIHLRGHTPGSIALLYRDPQGPAHLFTGDSLFPGGLGNTNDDAARFSALYTDVVTRIFDRLPDDTLVHPGHGDGTTLGAQRGSLAEWKERGW